MAADTDFNPQGDGLNASQRAQLDAVLQRLDQALTNVPPELAAVARAQAELSFYGNLHLDNNTRMYVIAQREALRDDMVASLQTIDNGLGVMMTISEKTIAQIEALALRVGDAPPDDPRSIIDRLAEADLAAEEARTQRLSQGRAIRAIFILIALAIFFGLLGIALALIAQPGTAALVSASSVLGAVWSALRTVGSL